MTELTDTNLGDVTSTITADVATIRAGVAREFRNHGDQDLAGGYTSTGDRLADELARNHPDADARVLRVLAARIAHAGVMNEDPLLTLTDIAGALKSLALAVAELAGQSLSDEDGREALATYTATIEDLGEAAEGVVEMAGWF